MVRSPAPRGPARKASDPSVLAPAAAARPAASVGDADEAMKRVLRECDALAREHLPPLTDAPYVGHLHQMARDFRTFSQPWTWEICFLLYTQQVLRFNQLGQRLPGMSTKTLANRLKRLQLAGLVHRTHYDESPPHVEYSLTARGRSHTRLAFALLLNMGRAAEP